MRPSPGRISIADVLAVARLARLDVDPAEAADLVEKLGAVLDHMAVLGRLDLTNVPPTSHVLSLAAPEREDQARPSLAREEALALAPDAEDGAFRVPKVVD